MNLKVLKKIEAHVSQYAPPLAESMPRDAFKILVSTILSAQTQDVTTARVCHELFKKVSKPSDFKKLSIKEIESIIKPINYYKSKARYLKGLETLREVPQTLEELTAIKGVGRKTANIVLNVAFGQPAIAVDVHCHRIPQRIGWFKSKNPHETEEKFKKMLPKEYWSKINMILVLFGQNVCKPIKPHCWECPITKYCEYYKNIYLTNKRKTVKYKQDFK